MERMKGHKKVKGYFVTLSKITSNWLKQKKAKSKVVTLNKAKSNHTNADQPSGHT